MRLYAARYDEDDYGGSAPVERFGEPAEVGLRWSVPFGLQRIEVTVRAESEFDAYARYRYHLGQTLAVYDGYADRYVAGQVYEIVLKGRQVTYICGGPGHRLNDQLYFMSDFPGTGNTDAIIKDLLSNRCPTISSDQSNIEATSLAIGDWDVLGWDNRAHKNAGVAILELAKMGASGGTQTDFYLVDQPFSGLSLEKPLPYLTARSLTADPDWLFSKADLARGGLTLSRNIWNLLRQVWVGAFRYGGTHTGSSSSAVLIDSTADFRKKIAVGESVVNLTQETVWTIDKVDSQTQLSFSPPEAGDDWDNGDQYVVALSSPMYQGSTSSETDLWATTLVTDQREMDKTQAAAYAAQQVSVFEKAVQQQSYVLGAPRIQSGRGVYRPLWRPIFGNSFYFRAVDLYPVATVFSDSDDREQTFQAIAMDYSYRRNRLRVVPSTGDSRLDILLAQLFLASKQTNMKVNEIVSV